MDLSSLSPDVLASLAQALQQGTSPTELLSQIVQQQNAAPPQPQTPKPLPQPQIPVAPTPTPAPFKLSSRQALDDRLNQKMLKYKSMSQAQQRANQTQNQALTPAQTRSSGNSYKGAPLSREEVERRNKELKAFKEAVKHHRNAGRKVPNLNDETLFNMVEKDLKRPLTAPPFPTTLAKMQQMAAIAQQNKKREIVPPKLVVPKDDPQPETKVQGQKGVVPLNIPAHMLRLNRNNTSISRTLHPKATARERMNALREQKQKQELTGPKAAQASISAAHQQLRQRAEALKQLLASQK